MSKAILPVYLIIILYISLVSAAGQPATVTIESDLQNPVFKVVGRGPLTNTRRNVSFRRSVAGVEGIAGRISDLRLFDHVGRAIAYRRLIDSEYLAESDFESWSYKIDLTPSKNRAAAAHLSWFANGTGILMLGDLLPNTATNATALVSFKSPSGIYHSPLLIQSSESQRAEGLTFFFEVSDLEDAIFYVGDWEVATSSSPAFPGTLLVSGKWSFEQSELSGVATQIVGEYNRLLGPISGGKPLIAIAKFPVATPPGEWQAETRGRNVTIISSDMPFKQQSVQRLHEQLRHELFHLWIPNGVNLTGSYDWFYEGFALYESLKLGVRLNRISFADFLDTLSRAHTIDNAIPPKMSLIQASMNRFGGVSSTQVYARGMLVAFLTDIELLRRSKGKRSVEDLLFEVMRWHRKPQPEAEGNAAVIKILRNQAGAGDIVDKYIEGTQVMDLSSYLSSVGLEDSDSGAITVLRVRPKLNGGQKDLLDKLSYNSWRKLPVPSK